MGLEAFQDQQDLRYLLGRLLTRYPQVNAKGHEEEAGWDAGRRMLLAGGFCNQAVLCCER